MASIETTGTDAQAAQPTDRGWKPYRLSVRQYLKMIDAGVFPRGSRVELLGGVLIEMMTIGNLHDYTLSVLSVELRPLIPAGWIFREEKSLQLGPRSRVQPDIAVMIGPFSLYKNRTPLASETALVGEVADSSYAYDRGDKRRRYAASKVPVYWIVNIKKRQIEVYREPVGAGTSATYQFTEIYGEDAAAPVLIDGAEVGRITVRDILP